MKKSKLLIALVAGAMALTASGVPVGTTPVHRPIIEEYTGTWCGWCIRGIVGMELLRETLGEDFIGVAYHNGDPMQIMNEYGYPNSIGGFPSAYLDRTYDVDAYYGFTSGTPGAIVDAVQQLAAIETVGDLEVTAQWTSEEKTAISVDVSSFFSIDKDNAKYALEVMMAADDLHGTASGWKQKNYYNGLSSYINDPRLGPWVTQPATVSGLHFNDVLVYTSFRISGSLPTTIVAYEDYDYNYTFKLSDLQRPNLAQQNKDNLRIVVLIVDTSNGKVVNANKCTISDYVPVIIPGDVNDNGSVNIDDVTALINHLLNNDMPVNEANADVDHDGKLGIGDVTTLINMLLTGAY